MTEPVYIVGVEFVSGSFTNISSDVLRFNIDRQLATLYSPPSEGRALLELANESAKFTPVNSQGQYYPNLIPGKQLRIRASYDAYLNLPGASGDYASTPDSAALDVTGDIEFIAYAAATDWTPTVSGIITSKFTTTGNQRSYLFYVALTTGVIGLITSVDGIVNIITESTVAPTIVDGSGIWLKANRDVNNGAAGNTTTFYYSNDPVTTAPASVSWTQLGSAVITAGTTSIFDSTAPLEIGSHTGGTVSLFSGKIYRAQVYNGIGGTLVADFNAADGTVGVSSFKSPTGETYTTNGNATIAGVYPLFIGKIDNFRVQPMLGARSTLVDVRDSMSRVTNTAITTSLFINIGPSSLFTEVMSQSAVNSFAADVLAERIPFAWYDNVRAEETLDDLVKYGAYLLGEDASGTMRLRNRYFGLFATAVNTFSSIGSDGFDQLNYGLGQTAVLNRVRIEGNPRQAMTSQGTIAWITDQPFIPASSGIGFLLNYVDPEEPSRLTPATSLQSPVSSSDWRITTATDGTGTDRTASGSLQITLYGASAVCSIWNGSVDAVYLSKFQIRGFSVQEKPAISLQTDEASSQALYGRHDFTLSNKFINNLDYTQDYIDWIINVRKEPLPDIDFTLKNRWPDTLSIDLGDVLSLVDSYTAVNSRWSVQSIQHDVSLASGLEHATTYSVRFYDDKPWLVLDDPVRGVLDGGRQLAF